MGVATGVLTVVLSSSVGSDFIDAHPPCWAIVLYQGCTIHTCIAVALDDLCWTVLCPLLCAQLPFVLLLRFHGNDPYMWDNFP